MSASPHVTRGQDHLLQPLPPILASLPSASPSTREALRPLPSLAWGSLSFPPECQHFLSCPSWATSASCRHQRQTELWDRVRLGGAGRETQCLLFYWKKGEGFFFALLGVSVGVGGEGTAPPQPGRQGLEALLLAGALGTWAVSSSWGPCERVSV